MIPPMRNSLRMAYHINQKTGVDKTPNQESFMDDTLQTLGAALTPGVAFRLGSFAEKYATRVASKVANDAVTKAVGTGARWAGNALDYTLVPGSSHITPGTVAANVAGGMVLDEAQRQAMGDPTVLPSGEALREFSKDQGRRELATDVGQPYPLVDQPPPPGVQQIMQEGQQRGSLAGAAGVLGGGAALALAARHALRGRVASPPVPTLPPSNEADIQAQRIRDTGFGALPPETGIGRRIDQATTVEAPVTQWGREFGVEQPLEIEMGQLITPHGKQLTTRNFIMDGILPDGNRIEPPINHFHRVSALPPDQRERLQAIARDTEILDDLAERRARAAAAAAANPNDPNAQRINTLWQAYDPSVRRYRPAVDEPTLMQNQWQPGVDPLVDRYMMSRDAANIARNEVLYAGQVIGHAAYVRNNANPRHVGLFEANANAPIKYDPQMGRDPGLGPNPDIRVHEPMSPEASLMLNLEAAARAAADNLGKLNVAHIMLAADPQRTEIRVVPHGDRANHRGTGTFTANQHGRQITFQTNRPEIADAINQSIFDDGAAVNFLNTMRGASQFGMVHGPAAIGQAPVSAGYNMFTSFMAQRAGDSYGYLSRGIRQIERATVGSNPILSGAADLVDIVDPTRIAAYAIKGTTGAIYDGARAMGTMMMRQAITGDGFLGTIARIAPNGQHLLDRVGSFLNDRFLNSWMYGFRQHVDSGAHELIRSNADMRERMMRDIAKWEHGTPRDGIALRFMKNLYNGYEGIYNHVARINEMTHFAQQYAIANTGRAATRQELRAIGEGSRRSAGDMSAQIPNKALRVLGKTIPFFRISLQSFRYLTHALFARGPWDSTLVLGRMGAVAGALYGTYKAIDEMGLNSWFYEELNDFERNGIIRLPTFEKTYERLRTGQWNIDREHPERNFYQIKLPQEAAIFLQTIMYGMEQIGLVNRGSNRGNTSGEKDLLYAAAMSSGIGNIPGLSAGLSLLTGKKIDITSGLKGQQPITDIKGPRAQYGDLPSGFPSVAAEALKSFFGFSGMMATQMMDRGGQEYKATGDIMKSVEAAWDEGKHIWMEKSIPTSMWEKGYDKTRQFSAMSIEINRIGRIADDLTNAYTNEFTKAGVLRGDQRRMIQDDEVKKMLFATQAYFNRAAMPKLQQQLTMLRNQRDNLDASKSKLPYEEIQRKKDALALEMRPWFEHQQEIINRYNQYLGETYGQRFQQEGLPPTVESVQKLVRKYSR